MACNNSLLRRLAALILLLAPVLTASGYQLQGTSWPDKTAAYHLQTNSNTFDAAFIEAMAKWNGLSNFSFTHSTPDYFDPCGHNPDYKNSYRFSTTNCGRGWNSSTLAVTTTWSNSRGTTDTDIVFNSRDHSWGVYDDSINNHSKTDFRRVAVHELGHALGLAHETINNAIMQPYVSNVIEPLQDDINGLRDIYGGTGTGGSNKTLTVSVTGSGSVSSSPAGIDCPSDCSQAYSQGTSVTLTAHPAAGQRLKRWSGACSGTGSCTVSMSANKSVSAVFEVIPTPVNKTLTVSVSGSGSVSSSPAGIDCPWDCSQSYDQGTSVTLTAHPAAGQRLKRWSGACSGTGSCTVSMSANKSVSAEFEPVPATMETLWVKVEGSGSVTSNPAGINCLSNTNCLQKISHGANVSLTPHPLPGWHFKEWGWESDCSDNTAAICTVSMTSLKYIRAVFEANPVTQHTLTVSVTGSGSVSSSPAGIACPPDCTRSYDQGISVTLTPHAASGWRFRRWSGACSGTGSCTLPLSSDAQVGAWFGKTTATRPSHVMAPVWLLLLDD